MGRPKGSKNKMEQASGTSETAVTSTASETSNEVTGSSSLGYVGDATLDPEREEIIKAYNEASGLTTETAPAEAETKEEKKEEKEKPPVPPAATEETAVETKTAEEKEEKKKEEIKTVPYDALHEEREKRKSAQARAKELEERIKALEAKTVAPVIPPVDETYLTDEEKKIREFEKKFADIEAKDSIREKELKQDREKTEKEKLEKNLADTDKTLMAEGYPGFDFLTSRVSDELDKLIKEDPDNVYLDNPDGWKKIYKEKVFPAIRELFVQSDRQTLMDDKKAAKTGANLAGSPGTAPKVPDKKTDEGMTYDEYLEMRRKSGL